MLPLKPMLLITLKGYSDQQLMHSMRHSLLVLLRLLLKPMVLMHSELQYTLQKLHLLLSHIKLRRFEVAYLPSQLDYMHWSSLLLMHLKVMLPIKQLTMLQLPIKELIMLLLIIKMLN